PRKKTTTTGERATAASSTLVDASARIATLADVIATTTALQTPANHHDLTCVFTMPSILPSACSARAPRLVCRRPARRRARETAHVRAPASDRRRRRGWTDDD